MKHAALLVLMLTCCTTFAQPCLKAEDVTFRQLIGTWRAEVEGAPAAVVALHRHPKRAGGLRGTVQRGTQRTEIAGDVDDGEVTLEESVNGVNISATWLGDVVEGSCGREIRGRWKAEGDEQEHAFVLRRP